MQHTGRWDLKLFGYYLKLAESLGGSPHISHKVLDFNNGIINLLELLRNYEIDDMGTISNMDKLVLTNDILLYRCISPEPINGSIICASIVNRDTKYFSDPSILYIVIHLLANG